MRFGMTEAHFETFRVLRDRGVKCLIARVLASNAREARLLSSLLVFF